jgi:hypothetical protein
MTNLKPLHSLILLVFTMPIVAAAQNVEESAADNQAQTDNGAEKRQGTRDSRPPRSDEQRDGNRARQESMTDEQRQAAREERQAQSGKDRGEARTKRDAMTPEQRQAKRGDSKQPQGSRPNREQRNQQGNRSRQGQKTS